MNRIQAWLQQPTSVAGLATVFGTLSALLSHQITSSQAIPLLSAAFVSIALRDNSVPAGGSAAPAGVPTPTQSNKE